MNPRAVCTLSSRLEDAGFGKVSEYHYTKVSSQEMERTLADEDLSRVKASWLRDVPESKLRPMIKHVHEQTEAGMVWAHTAVVKADWDRLMDVIRNLPKWNNVDTVVLGPGEADPHDLPDGDPEADDQNSGNTPFSYDPAQDYATEPDR